MMEGFMTAMTDYDEIDNIALFKLVNYIFIITIKDIFVWVYFHASKLNLVNLVSGLFLCAK